MLFETVSTGGCRSYVIGCQKTCAAALIDPELSQIDRYIALAARDGLRIRYLVDTHTHADHFSATQLRLDPLLKVFPAHEYKSRSHSTIGQELAENPRLQKSDRNTFIEMMQSLNLTMPTHITEALRTNMTGGKTVAQMLSEAAAIVPFMSLVELSACLRSRSNDLIVLDVRERDAFEEGHVPGARLLPRGQLELRVNQELTDPTRRILVYCEFGRISTLATATLRQMGFRGAVALDGGMKAWREAGFPLKIGEES